MKTAIVIGSTGLVGSHLTTLLMASKQYSSIILLNRRVSGISHPKVVEKIIDFEKPDLTGIFGEDVFCAIGTTIKKAGSQAAQFKIDCEYPTAIAALLKQQGAKQFMLVSSLGANAGSANFYLRTKGTLEKNIFALQYACSIIVRPSFILGERKEFRMGEKIGIVLMKLLKPLMVGNLKKYRGVQAADIAAKMISAANQSLSGEVIFESNQITD